MTFVPTGFPDWSRRAARSDERIFSGNLGPGEASSVSGILPVGGSAGLALDLTLNVGGVKLTIDWFLDDAGTILLTSQAVHLTIVAHDAGSIPCLGPFVRFTVTGIGGVGSLGVSAWTVWNAGPHDRQYSAFNIVSINGLNLAPGATSQMNATIIWPGIAMLSILTTAATFYVEIRSLDYTGAVTPFGRWDNNLGLCQQHTIALPANPVNIAYNNSTAGVANYRIYLNGATYAPIT